MSDIKFIDASISSGELVEGKITTMRQDDIQKCPHVIFLPSHYRDDGSCKCDDVIERKMMIEEWGYTLEDFEGVPLRSR